ncbi:fatty acid desaturase family protein [Streptomyces desertarenae]|uniref:Fatty acid desaturase family protein n=1 Tax=Streptomyces desertarenae TaxID=2666184 RepID=A0ABW4PGA4_9ACTN
MPGTAPPTVPQGPPGPAGETAASGGSEFSPLLRQVREQGLLEHRTGWYAAGIAVNALALAAVTAAVFALGDSWWVLVWAVPLAVLWARTAFVGHDAGHAQIAGSRRANRVIGLVHGNLLLGMSHAWWNDKHNRHHANPNHVDKDPDVGVGVLVWTQRQAAGRHGAARWLTRNQARLFFPLLLLEGVALKVTSIRMLRSGGRDRLHRGDRAVEAVLLAAHWAGYASLLLAAMPLGRALAFALVHHALFGLHLGCSFAPNHKGMQMPDPGGEPWGHLRRQVLTSRNVRGGPVTDWLLGGLNHQIEHHLFPSMPRPHLKQARSLVRRHCEALGVPYTETGVLDSYRQALRHMHEVGAELRA